MKIRARIMYKVVEFDLKHFKMVHTQLKFSSMDCQCQKPALHQHHHTNTKWAKIPKCNVMNFETKRGKF